MRIRVLEGYEKGENMRKHSNDFGVEDTAGYLTGDRDDDYSDGNQETLGFTYDEEETEHPSYGYHDEEPVDEPDDDFLDEEDCFEEIEADYARRK